MPSLEHTHTYVRYKARSGPGSGIHNKIYRCNDPDCTHFTDAEVLIGKRSICNNCGKPFILTREHCRRARPVCLDCSDTTEGRQAKAAASVMDKVMGILTATEEAE